MSPEKTKRIMIVPIKGADNPLTVFMAMAVGEEKKQTPAEKLKERLIKKGFGEILQSPFVKNIYYARKKKAQEFLMRDKLSHMDMLESIRQGKADICFADDICLRPY